MNPSIHIEEAGSNIQIRTITPEGMSPTEAIQWMCKLRDALNTEIGAGHRAHPVPKPEPVEPGLGERIRRRNAQIRRNRFRRTAPDDAAQGVRQFLREKYS